MVDIQKIQFDLFIRVHALPLEIIDIEQEVGRSRGESHIEDTRVLKQPLFEGFMGVS